MFKKPLGPCSFRDGSVVGGAFADADHLSPNGTPEPASTIETRFVAEATALLSRVSKSSASESGSLTISDMAGTSTNPGAQAATLSIDTASDHVINAAESTRVDFAGPGHGASGIGTFTDAADHQVVADFAGYGSCPTLSVNAVNPTDMTHTISRKVA